MSSCHIFGSSGTAFRSVTEAKRFRYAMLGALLAGWSTFAVAADAPAIAPAERTVLYHHSERNDLAAFYTWTNKHGRDQDPDRVFTLVDAVDGAPAVRVSGQYYGGFVTRQSYKDYRLLVEYRWGNVTWGDRKNKGRDSGILFHLSGEDGNNNKNFRGAWTRSVEYQILEGGTGDIWLVPGYDRDNPTPTQPRLTVTTKKHKLGFPHWDPTGTPTELKHFGRIGWGGLDDDWKPELGFRGRNDVEKPHGQWNQIELICSGGDVTYLLNGVKVNEGTNGTFKEGRLLFQSEGAEIFYRRIELLPLKR